MGFFSRIYDIARAEANLRFGRKEKAPKTDPLFEEEMRAWREKEQKAGSQAKTQSKEEAQLAEWYGALELPMGSDMTAVQKAWRTMLGKYHPDKHSAKQESAKIAHEVSLKLNEAYEGLKTHLKKAK